MSLKFNKLEPRPQYNYHRLVTGAPVVADAAIASMDPKTAAHCEGWTSIHAVVLLTGGTTPTVDIEQLARVQYTNASGVEQDILVSQGTTSSLGDRGQVSLTVNGAPTLLRIDAVSGNPTQVEIIIAGDARELADLLAV